MLLIKLKKKQIDILVNKAFNEEEFEVSLVKEVIIVNELKVKFIIDDIIKNRLLNGYDAIILGR